jgi:hypothetical protein
MAIERRVPRNVLECRQRDGRQPRVRCPGADAPKKLPADPGALMVRQHAHLLDVRASVDHIDEHVADR